MATKKTLIGNVPIKEMKQEVSDYIAEAKEGNALLTETFSVEDNPEFVETRTDSDGKLIESTGLEGEKTFYGDVEVKGTFKNSSLTEQITEATENKVDKEEGKSLIDENVAAMQSVEDNPEYMDVKTDSNGKVIAYRDNDGYLNENVGIKTKTLKAESYDYSDDNLSDLAKALKSEYIVNATDWSDYISNDGDNPLHLPEPRCAIINLITDSSIDLTQINKAANVAASYKGTKFDIPVEVQFWDKQGNYFRKKAYISGQGDSSLGSLKKNIAIDLFDSEYDGDAFSIKFGNWVAQDSYHAKAYYNDFIRGASCIAYQIADIVEDHANPWENKPWKRALIDSDGVQLNYNTHSSIEDLDCQFDTGALCHPLGFPVIIYQNEKFYGVYALCLKKHRDNYHMSKSNAKHIHIDGTVGYLMSGTLRWSDFEIRNPKNLYYKEAHNDKSGNPTYEYDADIAQAEIAGDDEVNAWIEAGQLPDGTAITSKMEKNLKMTAEVKTYITNLSTYNSQLAAVSDDTERKTLAYKLFDVQSMIDYEITNLIVCDTDGFWKNCQLVTYDGVKWSVCEYDKDMAFGNDLGMFVKEPWGMTGFTDHNVGAAMQKVMALVTDECLTKTKAMINDGTLSSDKFISMLLDWVNRVGYNNYEKEYAKWDNSPCNRDDGVDNTQWKRDGTYLYNPYNSSTSYALNALVVNDKVYKSLKANNTDDLTNTESWQVMSYVEGTTYAKDDVCYIVPTTKGRAYKFIAVTETTSAPTAKTSLGYKDNIWRFVKFIQTQVDAIKTWVAAQN